MSFCYQNNKLGLKTSKGFTELSQYTQRENQPFYLYDLNGIKKRLKVFQSGFSLKNLNIHYAMKANANKEILKLFLNEGIGLDIVSGGELKRALENGFKGKNIVFSGVAKSSNEIEEAIKNNIKQINVESFSELKKIKLISEKLNTKVNIGIRINPNIETKTHPYIQTGFKSNKFGVDESMLEDFFSLIKSSPLINFRGISMHIGSQITDLNSFTESIKKLVDSYQRIENRGFKLESINIGGGLGIDYECEDFGVQDEKNISEYGKKVSEILQNFKGEVCCEPGRVLVARFGALLGQVQYIKKTPYKNFAILNTGIHHFVRPALYQAYHRILPLEQKSCDLVTYDIVGPICESSDVLGSQRTMQRLNEDEWVSIMDVGAYGRVMANTYNFHELPKEITID